MMPHAGIQAERCFTPLWALLFAILALSGCGGGDGETPYASNLEMDRAVAGVRTSLESVLGNTVPSLSVLIQTSEGVFFSGSSAPGARRVSPDTYFRFASNTKNFTAAAIMKMHQDGWLNYTDRIVDRIPGSDMAYVPEDPSWNIPYKNRVTIRQLLHHNAGVYDVANDPVPGCDGLPYVGWMEEQNPDHQFTPTELVKQNVIHNLSSFPPGTGNYKYSNTGYTILGEIITRVYTHRSGTPKTYTDYLRDHVHGPTTPVPLNLHFPYLAADKHLPTPSVCGTVYAPEGEVVEMCANNMSANVAEGNGYGTMTDLNAYLRTLLKGQNILTAENVAKMMTDASAAQPRYALGTQHTDNLGYGHTGATHGYLSLMAYDPAVDVSVIVLLPLWDFSSGWESFMKCYQSMLCAGWDAREALGYPGRPQGAACPGG